MDVLKRFWKQKFSFSGRVGIEECRKDIVILVISCNVIMFAIAMIMGAFLPNVAMALAISSDEYDFFSFIYMAIPCGIGLIFFGIMAAALLVRRLHDTGRSGWWLLTICLPFLGIIWLAYLVSRPSVESSHS